MGLSDIRLLLPVKGCCPVKGYFCFRVTVYTAAVCESRHGRRRRQEFVSSGTFYDWDNVSSSILGASDRQVSQIAWLGFEAFFVGGMIQMSTDLAALLSKPHHEIYAAQ